MNDEQIKQVLESAGVEFQYYVHARTNKQVCTTAGSIDFNKIANGIRELIALARQVKPLDWQRRNTGWYAATDFGVYFLDEVGLDYRVKLVEIPSNATEIIAHKINGMDNAKEAAQQDYRRRVLSCLANGGGGRDE